MGNGADGIGLTNAGAQIGGTIGTTPGGPCTGACNVVASNNAGIVFSNSGSTYSTFIQGNYIGTDITGTRPRGTGIGVHVASAPGTQIGGSAPGAGNVISGNQTGVLIDNNTSNAVVQGNIIGLNATGTGPLGNAVGIRVILGTRNAILGNSIAFNGGLGIDLEPAGVTLNDVGDADAGPNNLQNFPVITSATTTQIQGTLNSTPNTTFTIQVFSNSACDASGSGEGRTLVASLSVMTDMSGNTSFLQTGLVLTPGEQITATATDPNGNTSEFSQCAPVSGLYGILDDPTGDASAGNPDLVRATITVDGGNITLSVRFAPGTFTPETEATFLLDTDENPATGQPGIDNVCTVDSGLIGWEYQVRMGSTLFGTDAYPARANPGCGSVTTLATQPGVTYFSDGLTVTFPLTALSVVPDDGRLRFKVTTQTHISGTTFTGFLDVLSDVGQPAGTVPGTSPFFTAGNMSTPRRGHTAITLNDGRVLLAGSDNFITSAEMFNPVDGSFTPTGNLNVGRCYGCAAVKLPGGKVLVAGGWNGATVQSTAELFDPTAGTFSLTTGSMTAARLGPSAILLSTGKVLIVGGHDGFTPYASAELYDPATQMFTATGSMGSARLGTAVLLANGRVLVAGGQTTGGVFLATAEIYNPATGMFSPTAGPMTHTRHEAVGVLLSNGKVLIIGGTGSPSDAPGTADLFDPATGTFTAVGPMTTNRNGHAAVLLPNGKALIFGGAPAVSSAEMFDPQSLTFTPVPGLVIGRSSASVAILNNNRILVTGGDASGTLLKSAEIYVP